MTRVSRFEVCAIRCVMDVAATGDGAMISDIDETPRGRGVKSLQTFGRNHSPPFAHIFEGFRIRGEVGEHGQART